MCFDVDVVLEKIISIIKETSDDANVEFKDFDSIKSISVLVKIEEVYCIEFDDEWLININHRELIEIAEYVFNKIQLINVVDNED